MKDSGVEWIGEIPVEWNCSKIKHHFKIGSGTTPKSDIPSYWDGDIVWITPADFKTDDVYVSEGHRNLTQEGFESSTLEIIPAGNIIFSKRAPIGQVVINSVDLCTNQGCLTAVPLDKSNVKYYRHAMSVATNQFELAGSGTTFNEISATAFGNFTLPSPNMSEQKRIAEYLDRKCSSIDSVIMKQQVIIEKLKEYKLSVINEALTHGLEETRNYKESGIDWIGKIPEHWSIQKLKTIVDILPGYAFSSNDFATDEGIPLLRGINVVPSGIRWNDVVFWNQEVPKYLEPYYLQENDIVVGLDRPWISDGMRTTIMNKDSLPCLLLQRVCRIRLKKECAYDHRLIYHWINSKAFESALSIETTGVSVPHISTKQIENFIIALPPNEEARSICDYLHVKTCEIDKSISIRSQLIGKLLDYKKSLIYEVVTGKREV